MSSNRDKIRRRITSRRRMNLAVVGVVAGCAVIALAIILIVSGLIPIQGDFDVYLTGPGIQKLSAGSPVAMGLQEVGHVKRIEKREGVPVAHVVIQREIAEQLPQDSKFAVESFNEWIPGNLGVRVYKPSEPGSSSPIEDESTFETNNDILPPDLPPKFYLLVVVGLLAIAVVLGLACAIYTAVKNLISAAVILVIGAAILLAVYVHLNGSITAPDPPFKMNPAQTYESVAPGELTCSIEQFAVWPPLILASSRKAFVNDTVEQDRIGDLSACEHARGRLRKKRGFAIVTIRHSRVGCDRAGHFQWRCVLADGAGR